MIELAQIEVLESLAASGPLALVLAAAVVQLWRELQKERQARVNDLKEELGVYRGLAGADPEESSDGE